MGMRSLVLLFALILAISSQASAFWGDADSDGDGVKDSEDADDDNDGLLDVEELVWSSILLKSHGCGKASIGPAPDSSPLLIHKRIGVDQLPGDRDLVLDLHSAQVSVYLE